MLFEPLLEFIFIRVKPFTRFIYLDDAYLFIAELWKNISELFYGKQRGGRSIVCEKNFINTRYLTGRDNNRALRPLQDISYKFAGMAFVTFIK